MQKYVVLQVTLKEKLIGTASKNLSELEDVINKQADKGYFIFLDSSVFEFFVYPLSFPNKNRIPRMRNFPGDSLY